MARASAASARRGTERQSGARSAMALHDDVARRADAGAPLQRLTGAYERVRFGGAALTADEAAELETCVATLERPGG